MLDYSLPFLVFFFMQEKIKNGFDPETHKLTSYMHAGNSHTDVEGNYHICKRSRLGQRLHVLYRERTVHQ